MTHASENLNAQHCDPCHGNCDACARAEASHARISPEFATVGAAVLTGLVVGAAVASAWFLIVGGRL